MFKGLLLTLNRLKTSNILNLFGLSIAFAVFSIAIIQTYYDFSYDRNFKNADNIYLMSIYRPYGDNHLFGISTPLAKNLKDEFPEIQNYCLLGRKSEMQFYTKEKDVNPNEYWEKETKATVGILDVFAPKIIEGNALPAFLEVDKVMLTQSLARKIFGKENPVGQIIFSHDSDMPLIVAAICEDFPENSSLENGIFRQLPEDVPENYNYYGYFEISHNQVDSFTTKVNNKFYNEDIIHYFEEHPEAKENIEFIPLTKIHLHVPELSQGNMNTTLSLLAIGILTLFIALINFVNFSIAIAPSRVRSLNIRKIVGAEERSLKLSIAFEGVFLAFMAFLISLFLILLLKSSSLAIFITADLSLLNNWRILLLICVALLLIAFFSGIYPAHYATSFQPAMALNGSFATSVKSSKLRNVLIVFQFVASISLIIVSGFIKMQHDYMVNYSLGIEKENIVCVNAWNLRAKLDDAQIFCEELKRHPDIIDYTTSTFLPGSITMSFNRDFEGKTVSFATWPADVRFLDFFGVPVTSGSNFSDTESFRPQIILNEEFMNKYGFSENDILGKEIFCFDTNGIVVGIAKDVNFQSLHASIQPMAFVMLGEKYNHLVFIKLSNGDHASAMSYIKETWSKFSDEPFDAVFVDSHIDNLYRNENHLATLVSLFGFIAVIISVMGVYGLIIFNAKHKTKEIAIRKVNGSTISEIMLMLNRNILILLGISFVVSIPLAYFFVYKWLQSFAYKTGIHWWVFLLGGIIILAITLIAVCTQSYKAAIKNPRIVLNNS